MHGSSACRTSLSSRPHLRLGIVALLLASSLPVILPAHADTPATEVTAPQELAIGPHLTNHLLPGFAVSGYAADTSLIARVWLTTAPNDASLAIGDPTGLVAANGITAWSGERAYGFRGTASAINTALNTLSITTGATTGPVTVTVSVLPDSPATPNLVINPQNGHLYRFISGNPTWTQARDAAPTFHIDGVDGYLVTITNPFENQFVRNNTPDPSRLWLGLTDRRQENVWRWETGPEGAQTGGDGSAGLRLQDVGYNAWSAGQPDNFFFVEDYAVMRRTSDATWNDEDDSQEVDGFVIEYSAYGNRTFPSARTATFTTTIERPPRTVSVTPGDTQAIVTWQAPLFGTVTGYTATATDPDTGNTLATCQTAVALSCTLTGLTNGSAVNVTVAATFDDNTTSLAALNGTATPQAPPPPPPPPAPDPEPLDTPAAEQENDSDTADPTPSVDENSAVPEPAPEAPAPSEPPNVDLPEVTEPVPPDEPPVEVSETPQGDTESTVVAAPTDPPVENPRKPPYPSFSALSEPAALVATATSGLALLAVAGSAGAAAAAASAGAGAARGGTQASRGSSNPSGNGSEGEEVEREGVTQLDVVALGSIELEQAAGDRSRLWRWPGTSAVDLASTVIVRRTTIAFPIVARIIDDGAVLRAMFGSLSLLAPLSGALLGLAAVMDTGGIAMPPKTAIMVAIVLLGLLDATAGFTAFMMFSCGVAITGGIVDADSVRTMLGIGVASFGPGLLAAAFRPLRRPPARTSDEIWERLTDVAVVAVVGAMTVELTIGSLSGIAGVALPISDYARPLALAALPILAVRVLLEEIAARHFPARLLAVVPNELPETPVWRQLATLGVKAAGFIFIGVPLIGAVWQLYAAAALFVLAPLVGMVADRLPNAPWLWRILPQGIPGFVALLLIGSYSAVLIENWLGATPDYARTSFVALSAPYTAVALLGLIGREGLDGEERWVHGPRRRAINRIGGVVMLAILIRLHLG